jgi:predicted nucleic acid-binding protein
VKIFLDTSVLVASSIEHHEHYPRALALLERIHEERDKPYTGAYNLTEIFAVLTRLPLSPRISPAEAAAILKDNILAQFEIVTLTAKEHCDWILSLGRKEICGGGIYDALAIRYAEKISADQIFTFNIRHFRELGPHLADRISAP